MELEKDYADEDNDVVYVNIWNTDKGELKLTHQKPMLKETFEKMEKSKNFSLFSNTKTFQSPPIKSTLYTTSNIFAPVTVKPVGGVGNPKLEQAKPSKNIFQNVDSKNQFFPFLSFSPQVRISDLYFSRFKPCIQETNTRNQYQYQEPFSKTGKTSEQQLETPASVLSFLSGSKTSTNDVLSGQRQASNSDIYYGSGMSSQQKTFCNFSKNISIFYRNHRG